MTRKKRGYKRDAPDDLVRDYKLFAIACEGSKTEPLYFKVFRYISNKIKVDIIEEKIHDPESKNKIKSKSAPNWVLDRAVRYVDQEGLIEEDELWFVMDVDRWDKNQLKNIADYCKAKPNWHIVLSNPCFEVWLYFHKKANILISKSKNCKDLKKEISTFDKSGYNPLNYIPFIQDAIKNAKKTDSDKEHYLPCKMETKVYLLAEAILEKIGKKDFEKFIQYILPELSKKSKKKKKKQ